MTIVTGDWLENEATQQVFDMMISAGHQVFVVGGCVRNTLLGFPVSDVDFATDARPERVMSLAENAGLRAIPTGIEHGTITLVSQDQPFEMTTFRKDVETDGRHAKVVFADNLNDDAHRRDFTMNALYADKAGQVSDPLGGLDDLKARHVRFIDDPYDRIREDYLRILRFFRFHAWFGDPNQGLNPDALAACAELAEGLEKLSKERVGSEMAKLLTAPDPAPSVASMEISGILSRVLPGGSGGELALLVHLESGLKIKPDFIRRLALLGGENQVDLLRLSRNDARRLRLYRRQTGELTSIDALAYHHGANCAVDIALLRAALLGGQIADDLVNSAGFAAKQKFPISAADITTGETGPALGARLRHLEMEWVGSGFVMNKAELLA